MNSQQIRTLFLEYFIARGHTLVPSSSLIPEQDPSLLFTNAGMVPFKAFFTGQKLAPTPCAVSIQRCLRAGGKHNDLENVGYTARHHTFFEMLGNFSFGAYFKREAIQYAWEFLTQVLKLPVERLWITVFEEDEETAHIWLNEIKINPLHFSRCGRQDNFWMMGETGPCGPCTEIFYDHGPEIAGGPPGSATAEGDRYMEIWNLVFMQYERTAAGELVPLPKPCVDTGMGLERIAAVMQGVHNNYETDLFQPLVQKISQQLPTLKPQAAVFDNPQRPSDFLPNASYVIADHLRAAAFLITDGVTPSNEGRGYVLRRILRRAIRHGDQLGLKTPFLPSLVPMFVQHMQATYPDLEKAQTKIMHCLQEEEALFANTLHQGMKYFEQAAAHAQQGGLSGEMLFKLYDTYGFPVDLSVDLAHTRGLNVDLAGFAKMMQIQRKQSQQASHFKTSGFSHLPQQATCFIGYETLKKTTPILKLLKDSQAVEQLQAGESGIIILAITPFYAEAGGQIGDIGTLQNQSGGIFQVSHTIKQETSYLHYGQVTQGSAPFYPNNLVTAEVDAISRQAITRHHSATHLLHAALKQVLGPSVTQKGSLVAATHLRFDFTYPQMLSPKQLDEIEWLVNQQILSNLSVITRVMSRDAASQAGAMALFEEKYGEQVRVLSMGDFSIELCGGTHVQHTGEIGLFKFTSSSGIAAGIRRVEAVAGEPAYHWVKSMTGQLQAIATQLKTDEHKLLTQLKKQADQRKQQAQEIESLRDYMLHTLTAKLLQEATFLQDYFLLISEVPAITIPIIPILIGQLATHFSKPAIIVLFTKTQEEIILSVGIATALTPRLQANTLVKQLAPLIAGKGGGRPHYAQLRGKNLAGLTAALKTVPIWIAQGLQGRD
jgi:alanyl-tRNA synthetase